MQKKIGIAIATFNSAETIEFCLEPLREEGFEVVLFDDGSHDDTVARAKRICPKVHILTGDGNHWWAGGTRRAMEKCLELGCQYVLMLNPDVRMTADGIRELARYADEHPYTISAALVVQRGNESHVAWAGSTFQKIAKWVPIYTSRYIAKRGTKASDLGDTPYCSDEAHGRGVLVPRSVIDRIGLLDDATFVHYGADNDYSWRARGLDIDIVILPSVVAVLDVAQTGMKSFDRLSFSQRLKASKDYLLERKNGDALRVNWHLYRRHVPAYAVPPTFIFNLMLNLFRRMK